MTKTIEFSHKNILNIDELKMSTRQALKKIIEKEGFKTYKATLKDLSTNGGGYFGVLQTVTVKDETDDKKELHLFMKNIVPIEGNNFMMDVAGMHMREGFFYSELVNKFDEIQDKYKIPQEEKFNYVKSYGVTESGLIIMEDISKAGYESFNRFDSVSLKFAELSMEQLAKFHAMSFVLKEEHPRFFEERVKTLRVLLNFNYDYGSHFRRIFNKAMETLDTVARTKLDNYFPKCIENYSKFTNVSPDEALSLVHGDYRPNNILIRKQDGVPSTLMPVDYQLMYFGYPIIDLIFFIFTGTDQEFRKKHLEYLKDLYFSTFENFLRRFGIKAENVYSRKMFEEEYKEKLDHGLICFLALMPFIFAKSDDVPEMEEGMEKVQFNLDERYKDRLHGVVDDFIQLGYL